MERLTRRRGTPDLGVLGTSSSLILPFSPSLPEVRRDEYSEYSGQPVARIQGTLDWRVCLSLSLP